MMYNNAHMTEHRILPVRPHAFSDHLKRPELSLGDSVGQLTLGEWQPRLGDMVYNLYELSEPGRSTAGFRSQYRPLGVPMTEGEALYRIGFDDSILVLRERDSNELVSNAYIRMAAKPISGEVGHADPVSLYRSFTATETGQKFGSKMAVGVKIKLADNVPAVGKHFDIASPELVVDFTAPDEINWLDFSHREIVVDDTVRLALYQYQQAIAAGNYSNLVWFGNHDALTACTNWERLIGGLQINVQSIDIDTSWMNDLLPQDI